MASIDCIVYIQPIYCIYIDDIYTWQNSPSAYYSYDFGKLICGEIMVSVITCETSSVHHVYCVNCGLIYIRCR